MTSLPKRILDRGTTDARLAWGRWTAGSRPAPDFVLIGTMRAGTTSLFRDLRAHPQVLPPVTKEIHYFDYHHGSGERWYRAHFPTARERSAGGDGSRVTVSGEATPNYLAHPHAAGWAAAELPETRFIVLLRNPVERAHSHWKLMRRLDHETLSFADALDAEERRLAPEWERMLEEPNYAAVDWFRYSYAARGHYADQLGRWFEAIDRNRFLIVRSEDYYAEPAEAWRRITRFIGISDWSPGNFSKVHGTASRGEDEEVLARLRTHFAPHNERLATLVGRDFAWD
jgi:hypothetical protein